MTVTNKIIYTGRVSDLPPTLEIFKKNGDKNWEEKNFWCGIMYFQTNENKEYGSIIWFNPKTSPVKEVEAVLEQNYKDTVENLEMQNN